MHNIYYIICEENINKADVMDDITIHAEDEGDGYSSKFTWHDDVPPLESEQEARKFIEKHDKGWYDDHAVRFKDYSNAKETAKIKWLVKYEFHS